MASQKAYIGIDVGGTKIAAGLVSGSRVGKVVTLQTQADKGKKQVLENIAAAITQIDSPKAKAIGVGFPGHVNSNVGKVVYSPNFSKDFKNVAVADWLSKRFKRPVTIDNDANCFALAEATHGAGKGAKRVVGITLGTGVGGGIIWKGHILHGKDGAAGEIGHTTVLQHGAICSCGQRGHVEAYASGTGISNTYHSLTGEKKTTEEIYTLAKKGDKDAKASFQIGHLALAEALTNTIAMVSPEIIVLGGGLSSIKDLLIRPAILEAKTISHYRSVATTKITVGKLPHASIIGAALLVS